MADSWVERSKERVTHSGWLEKQSKYLKEWRRRFIAFSLDSAAKSFVVYFKDESDYQSKKKERGSFALDGASVVVSSN